MHGLLKAYASSATGTVVREVITTGCRVLRTKFNH